MRTFSYWFCFAVVASASFVGLVSWLLSLVGNSLPTVSFLYVLMSFRSLVPSILGSLAQGPVSKALSVLVFVLVVRRIWLLVARREGVPHAFVGVQKAIAYMGTVALLLAQVLLFPGVVLHAGGYAPATLLLFTASFCIPWAFAITELLSLRKHQGREM